MSSEGRGEQNYGEESLHRHIECVPEYGDLENYGKLDEVQRFYNKKFEEGHDVHCNFASTEDYSRPNKRGE